MPKRDRKNRRTIVRPAIVNQKLTIQRTIPRPITPYYVAHACFNCRKSFKRTPKLSHICPECGRQMYAMGRSFKAPKQRDIEQWNKVQALYAYGFRFFSYRSFDCDPLPERFREVEEFVKCNPNHPLRVTQPDLSLLPITASSNKDRT